VLNVRRATLSDLINGNAALSAEMALHIEGVRGQDGNLLNMQASTTLIRFGKSESTLNASGYQTRSPAELQSLCNVGFRRRKALPPHSPF
jgi:plasmid maintenance system antidote protein VapI